MAEEALRDLTSLRSSVFGPQPKAPAMPAPQVAQQELTGRIQRGQRAEEALPQLGELESKATEEKIRAQEAVRKGVAAEQAKQEDIFAGREKTAVEARQAGMMAEPEFKPDRMELNDYRNLAGMLVGIGTLVGGKGKSGAMYSLQALNGMMQGYAEGRRDLFKTQQIEFDKALKSVDMHNKRIEREFNDAMSLINTDRRTALAKLKQLEAELGDGVLAADLRLNDLAKFRKDLDSSIRSGGEALKMIETNRQKELDRELRTRMQEQNLELRRQGLELRERLAEIKVSQVKNLKPPAKEIVQQNSLRNTLIPKLKEALPVLDRLNNEGKWNNLTTLLAIDPRVAEYQFRNDPEALNLILTLAYFRSKEFETAGKALTRKEDQILAPIVRGDLRVYEGIRNAMSKGVQTLEQEQKGLEKTYPYLEAFNKAYKGEAVETPQPSVPGVPDENTWVAAAKAKNPNSSDDELRAYYRNKYGAK